jgi:hypothetical protein
VRFKLGHYCRVTPAAGSVAILVNNIHASAALNGTLVISFASMKA